MPNTHELTNELQTARIAVYDDLLSAPRIVDVEPCDIPTYIEQIATKTYELAQQQGGSLPYTVIREVSENFIHARFKEPTISILNGGNTIRFADQGPGIQDKEHAQLPGFTSATSEMKQYIRGVGSGLPLAKEYLRFSNGRLTIEDNITEGTVITIAIEGDAVTQPVVYAQTAGPSIPEPAQPRGNAVTQQPSAQLTERQLDILALAAELGHVGPTAVKDNLGHSVATAHRELDKLEKLGYLESGRGSDRQRYITNSGINVLNR